MTTLGNPVLRRTVQLRFVGAWGEDTKGSSAGAAYTTYEKVYVGPTLTYDNANKLSLTGVTTPSTNLTVGTNTYDIGSAKVRLH